MEFKSLAPGYCSLFASARLTMQVETSAIARQITAARGRYRSVELKTGVPWYLTGIIHSLECGLDFNRHLFNGDSLTARTVNNPAGQPRDGAPPFPWEFSTVRALQYDGLDKWTQWDVPGICYCLEKYNGFGYRAHEIHSPYLWGGSNHYASGKFTSDGQFNPDVRTDQIGGAVLLKFLCAANWVNLKAEKPKS